MNTIKFAKKDVKLIAHRGLSGLEKENTCAAFVAAGNREAFFGIETDIHRTADGRFVLFHDDNTARVGIDSLVIEESTFDTLRNLQLADIDGKRGRSDLRLPTLEEYIGICRKYEKTGVLEFKNRFRASDVYKIVSAVDKMGYLEHVIFISFHLQNLVNLRKRYPQQPAQYLLRTWGDDTLETLKKYNLGLDMRYTGLDRSIVEQVHGAGLEVNCWTVDTKEIGEAMVDLGVDYITTDILE